MAARRYVFREWSHIRLGACYCFYGLFLDSKPGEMMELMPSKRITIELNEQDPRKAAKEIAVLLSGKRGSLSDGKHTFDELYSIIDGLKKEIAAREKGEK